MGGEHQRARLWLCCVQCVSRWTSIANGCILDGSPHYVPPGTWKRVLDAYRPTYWHSVATCLYSYVSRDGSHPWKHKDRCRPTDYLFPAVTKLQPNPRASGAGFMLLAASTLRDGKRRLGGRGLYRYRRWLWRRSSQVNPPRASAGHNRNTAHWMERNRTLFSGRSTGHPPRHEHPYSTGTHGYLSYLHFRSPHLPKSPEAGPSTLQLGGGFPILGIWKVEGPKQPLLGGSPVPVGSGQWPDRLL